MNIDVRQVGRQSWLLAFLGHTSAELGHRHLRHLIWSNTYFQLVVWVTQAVAHWLCLEINEVQPNLTDLWKQVDSVAA